MQINSFPAFFKLLLGKFSLLIYLRGVKIANYYPVISTCDAKCFKMFIYIYIYIIYIYIHMCMYIYIYFFSPAGETLKFKIEGKKGLRTFKRNLTRLMDSCCHIKIWLV